MSDTRKKPDARPMYEEPARVMSDDTKKPIIRVERRELIAEIYEDDNGLGHPPIHAAFLALADVISGEPQDRPSRFEFQYGVTKFTVEAAPVDARPAEKPRY